MNAGAHRNRNRKASDLPELELELWGVVGYLVWVLGVELGLSER